MSSSNTQPQSNDSTDVADIVDANLTADAFGEWHHRNEQQRNTEEGYHHRNDPTYQPDPESHGPSKLLNCHRMAYYEAANTPREEELPYGIFKFGHDFESYIEEFINQELAPATSFVRNVEHVEYDIGDCTVGGSTDPVIFSGPSEPAALFEIKTTKNISFVEKRDEADRRHRAQAHAYARGLQAKYNLESPPKLFYIYGDRESLEIFATTEQFDAEFWEETVIPWIKRDTRYRKGDSLPPKVDPDGDLAYMCSYCDFKERCGNYEPESKPPHGDDYVESVDDYWWDDTIANHMMDQLSDMPPVGFIPLKKHPEGAVISHLATYPDVPLTPTLATQYPELVEGAWPTPTDIEQKWGIAPTRHVADWTCPACAVKFPFGSFNWEGNYENIPQCPHCGDSTLRGPLPSEL